MLLTAADRKSTMTAVVCERYGPDRLKLGEVEKPEVADDGTLVRVHAASLNRADWYAVAGRPLVGVLVATRTLMTMKGTPSS